MHLGLPIDTSCLDKLVKVFDTSQNGGTCKIHPLLGLHIGNVSGMEQVRSYLAPIMKNGVEFCKKMVEEGGETCLMQLAYSSPFRSIAL